MERWEHYEDAGAGIGVRGYGGTEADAFEQAALALSAAVADPALVAQRDCVVIRCESPDEDQLLACWLEALRHKIESDRMLFSRFEVWLDGPRLLAHAWGEPVNPERHAVRVRLKRMRPETPRVAQHADGWLAQAVMDF